MEKLLDSFYLPGSALFYIQVFWGIDFILKYLLTEYDFDYIASACMLCLVLLSILERSVKCILPQSQHRPRSRRLYQDFGLFDSNKVSLLVFDGVGY